MKKILIGLSIAILCNMAYADIFHCPETYKGKPWVLLTLPRSGWGRAECHYRAKGDLEVTTYARVISRTRLYPAGGNWENNAAYEWCSIERSNQYNTCLFSEENIPSHREV